MSNDNKIDRQVTNEDTEIPVLPVRDIVMFPGMLAPLFVGRDKSVSALEAAMVEDKKILIVSQKDGKNDEPTTDDMYGVGTICRIAQMMKLPDGTVKLLVEGLERATINDLADNGDYFVAQTEEMLEATNESDADVKARQELAIEAFEQYVANNDKISGDVLANVQGIADPSLLADAIVSHMLLPVERKQELLEQGDVAERLEMAYGLLQGELDVAKTEARIKGSVKKSMEKTQREYFLHEQMKAIQKELNDGEEPEDEIADYEARIAETDLSEEAQKQAIKELKKLKNTNPQGSEATVLRNYLDALLDVPWNKPSKVNNDTKAAREILDKDHYGLDKVKDKVVKQLAIQKRLAEKGAEDAARPKITCLVGPPGVGKTSICKSLAKATGREYVRMALGGVSDEAKIRGHRRTYIGAKPGEIIEKMTKVGTSNPLFVLDEVDKLGKDHKGDPASALLEVLDPEQNHSFNDHYLEVDYDLSDVMFVATANDWHNIPRPLQDRMDTIFLGSYMPDEKFEIAKRHLVAKQMKATGLDDTEFSITDDALHKLINCYVSEAGVRNLEREIGNVCGEAVMALEGDQTKVEVTVDNLEQYAGKPKFSEDKLREENQVGVITGLAYTAVGGCTLDIHVVKEPATAGKIVATGGLGDTFKESIQVIDGWIRANAGAGRLADIKLSEYNKTIFHIDQPDDSPVDGPSAGGALLTAVFSAASGKPIRRDVAMTGKMDLMGNIRPIGGVREKLSAAVKDGYKKILLPKQNEKDLDELPQQIKDKVANGEVEIVTVSKAEEVLNHALVDGFELAADGTHSEDIAALTQVAQAPAGQDYRPV